MPDLIDTDVERVVARAAMARAVINDLEEAGRIATRSAAHQIDALKAQVEVLQRDVDWQTGHRETLRLALATVVGQHASLAEAVAAVIERSDAPQVVGLADVGDVLKEAAESDDTVRSCLLFDGGDLRVIDSLHEVLSTVRRLGDAVADQEAKKVDAQNRVAQLEHELTLALERKARPAAERLVGPCVITRKDHVGRRFWAGDVVAWVHELDRAIVYGDVDAAEEARPRMSKVVTVEQAKQLVATDVGGEVQP